MGDIVSSQFNTCLKVLEAISLFSKGCSGSMVGECHNQGIKDWVLQMALGLLEWRTSPGKVIITFLSLKLLSVVEFPSVVFITNSIVFTQRKRITKISEGCLKKTSLRQRKWNKSLIWSLTKHSLEKAKQWWAYQVATHETFSNYVGSPV